MTGLLELPFTQAEFDAAYEDWGCNCGPTAIAFALQISLDRVKDALPDFPSRRYTNVTMMRSALARLGQAVDECSLGSVVDVNVRQMFAERPALVRLQWDGPWIMNGKPARWAATATHWIVAWMIASQCCMVFDCNGGPNTFGTWEREIVPAITTTIKRATGKWWPTHIWRLTEK